MKTQVKLAIQLQLIKKELLKNNSAEKKSIQTNKQRLKLINSLNDKQLTSNSEKIYY